MGRSLCGRLFCLRNSVLPGSSYAAAPRVRASITQRVSGAEPPKWAEDRRTRAGVCSHSTHVQLPEGASSYRGTLWITLCPASRHNHAGRRTSIAAHGKVRRRLSSYRRVPKWERAVVPRRPVAFLITPLLREGSLGGSSSGDRGSCRPFPSPVARDSRIEVRPASDVRASVANRARLL